jgi:hypothetical protein
MIRETRGEEARSGDHRTAIHLGQEEALPMHGRAF